MRKTIYFISISLAAMVAQFSCLYAQTQPINWHDWDNRNLQKIKTHNCTRSFNETVVFDGKYSIKIDHNKNASITFPYRYAGNSLFPYAFFHLTIYNPASTHKTDTFNVAFYEKGSVKSLMKVVTRRAGWNRYEARQTTRSKTFKTFVDIESLSDLIPNYPDSIRIIFPKENKGSLYIGKFFLAGSEDWKNKPGELHEDFAIKRADPIKVKKPNLPTEVSEKQIKDLNKIATNIDELYGIATYAEKTIAIDSAIMNRLIASYKEYNITRRGSVLNGNNKMLYKDPSGWKTYERLLGELMLEIAVNYRNTVNKEQRAALLKMYYDLFDFSSFIGGVPDYWSGGFFYTPAVFVMRKELKETGRLTPTLIEDYQDRFGYKQRIFYGYSYYIRESSEIPHKWREDETGEDIDYLRITSLRLIMMALLEKDDRVRVRDMQSIQKYFSEIALTYSPAIKDGFKPDGVNYHHWGWIDQYGLSALIRLSKIYYVMAKTEFQLSENAYKIMHEQLYAQDMRSLWNIVPKTTSGKSGEPYQDGGNLQEHPERYGYMALAGSPDGSEEIDKNMARIFLRAMKDQRMSGDYGLTAFAFQTEKDLIDKGYRPVPMPSGHQTLSYGCVAVHRRDNWLLTMKGTSKFQYVKESADPWTTYLGYGLIDINDTTHTRDQMAKLSNDIGTAGYDWRKYPGTTTIHFSDYNKVKYTGWKRYYTDQTFVGGITQDDNGAFVLRLHKGPNKSLDSFYADKSWFFFDQYVVALGSNINNDVTDDVTGTTLYQDAIVSSDNTYFNNDIVLTGFNYTETKKLNESAWLMDSHNRGYWVPSENEIHITRANQTNPKWKGNGNVSGNFATAWINHGKAPNDAKYWYILRIATTPSEMSDFDTKMDGARAPFSLLRLDKKVHAIESSMHNTYGAIVMDNSEPVDVKDIKSVSAPCILMVKKNEDGTTKLSVSDPDLDYIDSKTDKNSDNWGYSQPHTTVITLEGKWSLGQKPISGISILENSTKNTTQIEFILKDGLTSELILKQKKK